MRRQWGISILAWWTGAAAVMALTHHVAAGDSRVRANVAPPRSVAADAMPLTRYASLHYEVYTNLPREQAAVYGRHLDMLFDEYSRRFNGFPRLRNGAMNLYLLQTEQQYLDFLRSHNVKGQNTSGMFVIQPTVEGLVVWAQGVKRSQVFTALQHEGFHQFAAMYIGPELPIWLNEGLAEYFEDGIVVRDAMRLGMANSRRVTALREALSRKRLVPLAELVAMSGAQWTQMLSADRGRAAQLYDQAWSLVYFLVHGEGGRFRPAFDRYILLLSRGVDNRLAFDSAFETIELSALQGLWERDVARMQTNPVSTATSRMEFLGEGLKLLHENRPPAPVSLDDLERTLRGIRLRTTQTINGVVLEQNATDDGQYRYTLATGGAGRFVILEPARLDLPPRIVAPGISPEPTLLWLRNESGELESWIEYR